MGKVKVRVIGDETQEQEQLEEQKKKREAKQLEKKAQVKGVNLGGGERINSVGVSEEEIAREIEAEKSGEKTEKTAESEPEEAKKSKARGKKRKAEARIRSGRHNSNTGMVAKNTVYPVLSGIELLRKFKKSNFDETVELHINVKEKGVSGSVSLPHGTGKKLRIAVADDALIDAIEKGKIDFDVLVARPAQMAQLAKVARVLGPKGLMPNPKNGTISDNPEEVVKKLEGGQVSYKTEAAAPLIHMSVGKLSFEDKKLEENIKTILNSIGAAKISAVTLKSTMSPAIPLQA